jgi:aminocarboxymuconate-semialdehyde decarboxylase
VIDTHSHYFPKPFLESLRLGGAAPGFDVDFGDPARPVLVQGAIRTPLDPSYWDLEKRVQRMDAEGIGIHVLSLTNPMVHWAPPERGAALARIVNDAMVQAHAQFPDRFVGCATLPLQTTDLALKEIDRLSGQSGIRGVCLPTNLGDRELSHPSFLPIYERCEMLGLTVLLHPVTVIGANRLLPYYLGNLLGNPYDTGLAATALIFGGVLDRFPRLNVILPHGGGTFPYVAGRLEHGQAVRPEIKGAAEHPVGAYLRRFHYDTIIHTRPQLRFLVDLVGTDRVVLGSDYCFDMGDDHPVETVAQLKLRAVDRDRILFTNAKQLFRL